MPSNIQGPFSYGNLLLGGLFGLADSMGSLSRIHPRETRPVAVGRPRRRLATLGHLRAVPMFVLTVHARLRSDRAAFAEAVRHPICTIASEEFP